LEFVTPAKTALKVSKIGLGTWQFYGPSTRPGNRYYLHLVMPPYEAVSVWGVRVKRTRIKIVAGPEGLARLVGRVQFTLHLWTPPRSNMVKGVLETFLLDSELCVPLRVVGSNPTPGAKPLVQVERNWPVSLLSITNLHN
jgi:hypothetical protein